jgi:hypothetical protein
MKITRERMLADQMMKAVERFIDKKKLRATSKGRGDMKWVLEDIDEIVMQAALRINRTLSRKAPTKRAAAWNVGKDWGDVPGKYTYKEGG